MNQIRSFLLVTVLAGTPMAAQVCARSYDHVSSTALACFRTTGPQHGITLSPGSSGNISAPGGGSGSFIWDSTTVTLNLRVDHLPPWLKCGDATREFDDFVNACKRMDAVTHVSSNPDTDVWRIDSPNVLQPETMYTQIRFVPLDRVELSAGGCDQNGGHGDTWRHYVEPANDAQHHGLVLLPGFSHFQRIMDVAGPSHAVTLPASIIGDGVLHLGFESSDFAAGGYWGRDPGPNGECVGQPNAWVLVTITHHRAN